MKIVVQMMNRISAAYILLFCFVPPIQVDSIYRLIAIGASGVWGISVLLITNGKISKKAIKFLCISFACVLLMFIARTNISSIGSAFANVLQPIIIVLIALISMYSYKYDPKFLEIMFPLILILVCFYCKETINAAIDNPYAARIANSEWLEGRFVGNENVGLYGYVYMCVFIVPLLVYKIIRKIRINLFVDILCIITVLYMISMIAVSGYMIAIFCTILGSVMAVLLNRITKRRVLLVLIIGIVLWTNQETIIESTIDTIAIIIGDNPVYNEKLDGFKVLYEEGELGESSWEGRISNYADSAQMIVDYPIFGAYFWGNTGGGGHSTFLDTIGRYGWLTAILYFLIMWTYPRKIVSEVSDRHPLYLIILIILVVFGILDPYCQELAIPLFVFMPYIVYLEKRKTYENIIPELSG